MNKKYVVRLSEKEKKFAQEILNSKKTAVGYKKRANVLLLLDESVGKPATQAEIAQRCGVSDVTIYHTIRDFCQQGIEYALQYKKAQSPPRAAIVTGEKEARIIALACGEPPKGYSRWTVRLLTKKIIELSIVPTASRETVRRMLKKLNLSLT